MSQGIPKPVRRMRCALFLALACVVQSAAGLSSGPALIKSTRTIGNEVVVTAFIPAGKNQVTLQTRGSSGGAWVPRSVKRVNGKARNVVFGIAKSKKSCDLPRLGRTAAAAQCAFMRANMPSPRSRAVRANLAPLVNSAAALAAPAAGTSTSVPTSTVAKPDIWQIDGTRLYFFNQYRGLQVIDITNPDAPSAVGATGRACRGRTTVCAGHKFTTSFFWHKTASSDNGQTDVDVVNVGTGISRSRCLLPGIGLFGLTAALSGPRFIWRARRLDPGGTNHGARARKSVRLIVLNPTALVARSSLWLSGYGNVVTATSNSLFVSADDPTNWWQSDLNCIDISAGDGSMKDVAVIQTAGQIGTPGDINLSGNVLTVVSQSQDQNDGTVATALETFSLANPAAPVALGSLQVAADDYLSAANFDSNLRLHQHGQSVQPALCGGRFQSRRAATGRPG